MLLNDIVEISRRVGEVSGRLAKIELLAGCLRRAVADEIEIAAAWLSGELRQGRIGIGYAALRAAMAEAGAPAPSLDIRDVDAALDRISKLRGSGSAAERLQLLRELFVRATRAEQEFLVHL